MKKLREKKGEFILNHAFELLFVCILMVLFVSVLGVVNQFMTVHSMAADLSRYIEIRGQVDDSVYQELERLESVTGIHVNIRIDAEYIRGSNKKIQFGDQFELMMVGFGEIRVGRLVHFPIPLNTTVVGRSEQYWQN